MGFLDAARGLVWPTSMPRAPRSDPPRKVQATWPTIANVPPSLGGATPDADFWASTIWTVLGGEASLLDRALDYDQFYREQPWIFTLCNALNRGIGRLPLKVYRTDSTGNRERLRPADSPLAALLDSPWPRATPTALKQFIVGEMAIYGNALLLKVASREGDPPTSLEPLPALGWRYTTDGMYTFTSPRTGEPTAYEPWRILHFRHWGPGVGPNGFAPSPLEPLKKTVSLLDAAQRLGLAAFRNGGNPAGYLTTDAKLAEVEKSVRRIALEWAQKHGGADNAYRTPVLTDGLNWHSMGGTMNDAAVVDHHRLGREDVCAVFDVPPPIVQILDRATFSNVSEQARWLVQHTYNKYTTLLEETFAAQLIAGVPAFAGQFVEFDVNEILKGDPASRFTAYAQALNAGWLTPNEVRAIENLPRVDDEDADLLHRPLNLTPIVAPEMSQAGTPAGV